MKKSTKELIIDTIDRIIVEQTELVTTDVQGMNVKLTEGDFKLQLQTMSKPSLYTVSISDKTDKNILSLLLSSHKGMFAHSINETVLVNGISNNEQMTKIVEEGFDFDGVFNAIQNKLDIHKKNKSSYKAELIQEELKDKGNAIVSTIDKLYSAKLLEDGKVFTFQGTNCSFNFSIEIDDKKGEIYKISAEKNNECLFSFGLINESGNIVFDNRQSFINAEDRNKLLEMVDIRFVLKTVYNQAYNVEENKFNHIKEKLSTPQMIASISESIDKMRDKASNKRAGLDLK